MSVFVCVSDNGCELFVKNAGITVMDLRLQCNRDLLIQWVSSNCSVLDEIIDCYRRTVQHQWLVVGPAASESPWNGRRMV